MNKYIEKIAQMQASGSSSVSSGSTSKVSNNAGKAGVPNLTQTRGFRSLRMGSHTTPDDLLPNPQKMDMRIQ